MKIEAIRIENYKVFKDLHLKNLPELAIFVGENGVGKTTLFDVFGFLHDALQNNVRQALARRGGYKEVISREATGSILIELKFRLQITNKNRLVTYHLEIASKNDTPYVERESLSYKRGSYGSPYHYLDFKKGEGYAITNEEDFDKQKEELIRGQQVLDSPDTLAIKGLGQFKRFKAASAFRDFIERWHVSDFHISEARPSRDAGYAEHLSPTGENLPLVAQFMYEKHPDIFAKILQKMEERVPGMQEVSAEATVDGRIVLKFKDGSFKDPFIARYVSDGTIKMFAYLILLHDPEAHPLLCVEEPENQLYPLLLNELLEEFRLYAQKGGQVFITSHSPDFLNGAELEEVYWLKKQHGYTKVYRAQDNKKITKMCAEGEKIGWLWEQNFFTDE